MPDLEQIAVGDYKWPKRGRKPKPVPEALQKALTDSFTNETIPHLDMLSSEVVTFGRMLTSAGRKLNMRIEREIEVDVPEVGYSRYHFRTRSRLNKDEDS